ncbi:MAG: hypothetical protein HS132_09610 [Planctomycetia bacterium]|nr:hypothetical protein [Planctomycetia bacterium]
MAWIIRLSKEAEKQFERLPKDRQRSIFEVIEGMQEYPFRGNVIQLKEKEWQGRFRKVVVIGLFSFRITMGVLLKFQGFLSGTKKHIAKNKGWYKYQPLDLRTKSFGFGRKLIAPPLSRALLELLCVRVGSSRWLEDDRLVLARL